MNKNNMLILLLLSMQLGHSIFAMHDPLKSLAVGFTIGVTQGLVNKHLAPKQNPRHSLDEEIFFRQQATYAASFAAGHVIRYGIGVSPLIGNSQKSDYTVYSLLGQSAGQFLAESIETNRGISDPDITPTCNWNLALVLLAVGYKDIKDLQ